jgi:hypothetical protein
MTNGPVQTAADPFSNYPVMRTSGIGIDATGHVWLYRNGALVNVGIPPSWTPGLMEASAPTPAAAPPPEEEKEEEEEDEPTHGRTHHKTRRR